MFLERNRGDRNLITATMTGRGKGGKGLGKGGAKRHRKLLRDNIQGITKSSIRKLARRGGVKRISGLFYEETRGVLKAFLENTIRDAVTYADHARRRTVTVNDVLYALKRNGRPLYGFVESSVSGLRRQRRQVSEVAAASSAPEFMTVDSDDEGLPATLNRIGDSVITQKVIDSLAPRQWLDDVAIKGSLEALAVGSEWFVYNTLFWPALTDDPAKVSKFYRKKGNIAARPKFIVPMHLNNGTHWAVMMVNLKEKCITYYDSLAPGRKTANGYFDRLWQYLETESRGAATKAPFYLPPRDEWTFTFETEPRQKDGFNCGVYVYMRVRKLISGKFMGKPDEARKEMIKLLTSG